MPEGLILELYDMLKLRCSHFFSFVWFCPNGHAKILSAVLISYNAKYNSTLKISGLKNRILLREMVNFSSKIIFCFKSYIQLEDLNCTYTTVK